MAGKFEGHGVQLDADELAREFRGWKLSKILGTLQARYAAGGSKTSVAACGQVPDGISAVAGYSALRFCLDR